MAQVCLAKRVAERLDLQASGGREQRVVEWLGVREQDPMPTRLDRHHEDPACLDREGGWPVRDVVLQRIH